MSTKQQPRLIILCGFAGAGKSTIATRISETFQFPIFSADTLGYFFKEAFHAQLDGNSQLLSAVNVMEITYDVLFHLIAQELSRGLTVILDNNMGTPRRWKSIAHLKASVKGLAVLPILLHCPFEESVKRADIRAQHDTSGIFRHVDAAFLQQHKAKYDFLHNFTYPRLLTIDATQSIDEVWKEVLLLLETWLQERKKENATMTNNIATIK